MGSSLYQLSPMAKSFSTFVAMGEPAARIFSVVARVPAASKISKGPSSQLKPVRMAVSISTMLSAISGMRLAA